MTALVLHQVAHAYESAEGPRPVLAGASLALEPGKLALLVGPSGSGKSTLLAVASGLLQPSAGEVRLLGRRLDWTDPGALLMLRREALGFVFQQPYLLLDLTVLDNVRELLIASGISTREATRRAREELDALGLAELAQRRAKHLSVGQRQRVALARALARRPQVLLADEPTAPLDEQTAAKVMNRMKTAGCACLVVTHDVRLQCWADAVFHLEHGRVAAA